MNIRGTVEINILSVVGKVVLTDIFMQGFRVEQKSHSCFKAERQERMKNSRPERMYICNITDKSMKSGKNFSISNSKLIYIYTHLPI